MQIHGNHQPISCLKSSLFQRGVSSLLCFFLHPLQDEFSWFRRDGALWKCRMGGFTPSAVPSSRQHGGLRRSPRQSPAVPAMSHRDSGKGKSPPASGPQFPRRTPESSRMAAAAKIARLWRPRSPMPSSSSRGPRGEWQGRTRKSALGRGVALGRGGEGFGHPSNYGHERTSGASQSPIGPTCRTAHSPEAGRSGGHGSLSHQVTCPSRPVAGSGTCSRETQSRGQQWRDIPIMPNLVPGA